MTSDYTALAVKAATPQDAADIARRQAQRDGYELARCSSDALRPWWCATHQCAWDPLTVCPDRRGVVVRVSEGVYAVTLAVTR